MILRPTLATQTPQTTQTALAQGNRARRTGPGFSSALDAARQVTANRSRANGRNSSATDPTAPVTATPAPQSPYSAPSVPKAGDIVISPFNPLGLPISGALAPTAAEVTADPLRWKGTSFDPTLSLGQTVIQPYTET
ncbi:MAG: hypothetical protein JNK48_34740 [Bryobacterales bacterium]|nr:hypothetical protein [Bryobacterales bacterium]